MPITGHLVLQKVLPIAGGDATFKVGVQFDRRTKIADEKEINLTTAAQFAAVGMPTDFNAFSIDKPFQGQIKLDYAFHYFDINKMQQASDAARMAFAFNPVSANNYNVREEIVSGFAMGTLRYEWGSAVGGVRVEQVKNRGIALATLGATAAPVTAKSERTLVFPSLHLNYNLDPTKKLRLSFNSGAAHADYDQVRPNVLINDSNSTISGGNPAIKPEKAYGVDAYGEWYLLPSGFLSLGAFYKKVEDVMFTERRDLRFGHPQHRRHRSLGLHLLRHQQCRRRPGLRHRGRSPAAVALLPARNRCRWFPRRLRDQRECHPERQPDHQASRRKRAQPEGAAA